MAENSGLLPRSGQLRFACPSQRCGGSITVPSKNVLYRENSQLNACLSVPQTIAAFIARAV